MKNCSECTKTRILKHGSGELYAAQSNAQPETGGQKLISEKLQKILSSLLGLGDLRVRRLQVRRRGCETERRGRFGRKNGRNKQRVEQETAASVPKH